jgi:RNA polymerase sigma-70 factor (ECF subfamily)
MASAAWDARTVAQALEGRPGAYARLVAAYGPPVRRAVYRIVRDHDRAGDLTQQAFVAAWENLDRYDPEHRFFSWIYRIALNAALNAVRGGRHLCCIEDFDLAAPAPDPEQALLERERRAALDTALSALPLKYRLIVALRYELGLSGAEIASILGVPATTVKSRLHSALVLLRKDLGAPKDAAALKTGIFV